MMGRDFGGELLEVLDRWRDERVAVRVVGNADDLMAVFSGRLRGLSDAKGASLFWPIELDGSAEGLLEQPGIYAHPQLLSDMRLHVGGFVVEFVQAAVTVNVRRLDSPAG